MAFPTPRSDAPLTGIQSLIDRLPIGRGRRMIVFLSFLIMVADGMDITIISHVLPHLIPEWGVGASELTITISAGVLALGVGALLAGPAADRWGRRPIIVTGFVVFNVFTALAATAPNIETLIALRVVACLGLGAVAPVVMTLVADWVPAFRRAQLVAFVFSGVALGSIVGAYLAAVIIPSLGWRVLLLVAGLLPLIITVFFVRSVPEAPSMLVQRGRSSETIRRTLLLVAPEADVERIDLSADRTEAMSHRAAFAIVLSRMLALSTMLLWALFFLSQFLVQVALQYLPTLLQQPSPGLNATESGVVVAMWGWGALIGQIGASFLLKRFDRFLVGVGVIVWALVAVLIVAAQSFDFVGLLVVIFLVGLAIPALTAVTNGIATVTYPTEARGTGVGAAGFAGRLGALGSGIVTGVLLGIGWGLQAIFAAMCAPLVASALLLLGLRADAHRRARAADRERAASSLDV